jgi:transposase
MQRLGLPALLDEHFPTHGHWQGLSLGWVTTVWLSSILSRSDHRLVHVEPWVANRLGTLRTVTEQAVNKLDFPDDRLEIVLRHLQDDARWVAFASALNQHTIRVYELPTDRVHVDSTSASAYTTVTEEGLGPFGHRKDHRPALPQVKVMQAVLAPLGLPLAPAVVSGARAADPLYGPGIERVQASLARSGLLSVGDCKMASHETRAFMASRGDVYWGPLPQGQRAASELDGALQAIWSGEPVLSPVWRERETGKPEQIAAGYEYLVPQRLDTAGKRYCWTERRLAAAIAQIEALNHRGRGKQRFEEVSGLRQAVGTLVHRYGVAAFVW